MTIPFTSTAWGDCTEPVAGGEVATLTCIPVLMANIIGAFMAFAGLVALIFIIWGGIKYTSSKGDPQAIDSAKKTITWAIVGLVFIIFSYVILTFIEDITGANITQQNLTQ